MTIREALSRARERRGITYRELGEAIGAAPTNVHHALNHPQRKDRPPTLKSGMTVTYIEGLCDAMGIGVTYRPGQGWSTVENWPGKDG